MKKLLGMIGALLLAFIAVYAVWVRSPGLKDPDYVKAAIQAANERHRTVQALAVDPEQNGYLAERFLPYWGRLGSEYVEGTPEAEVVLDWREYSSTGKGELIDHGALRARDDRDYLKALSDFEALAPELYQAMRRPIFAPPNSPLSFDAVVPNFVSVRACAQAMVGLAEERAAQGRSFEAAELLVTVIGFGRTLQKQEGLIYQMIGVAIQSLGWDAYLAFVDPNSAFSGQQWKELAGRLAAAVPETDQVAMAIEADMAQAANAFDKIAKEQYGQSISTKLFIAPGWLSREERIYQNSITYIASGLRNHGVVHLPNSMIGPDFADYFTGRAGVLSQLLTGSIDKAHGHTERNRRTVLGLALAAAVSYHRAEHGRLPQNLDQVLAEELRAELEKAEITYQLEDGEARLVIPYADKNPHFEGKRTYPTRDWFRHEADGLVLIL